MTGVGLATYMQAGEHLTLQISLNRTLLYHKSFIISVNPIIIVFGTLAIFSSKSTTYGICLAIIHILCCLDCCSWNVFPVNIQVKEKTQMDLADNPTFTLPSSSYYHTRSFNSLFGK